MLDNVLLLFEMICLFGKRGNECLLNMAPHVLLLGPLLPSPNPAPVRLRGFIIISAVAQHALCRLFRFIHWSLTPGGRTSLSSLQLKDLELPPIFDFYLVVDTSLPDPP